MTVCFACDKLFDAKQAGVLFIGSEKASTWSGIRGMGLPIRFVKCQEFLTQSAPNLNPTLIVGEQWSAIFSVVRIAILCLKL